MADPISAGAVIHFGTAALKAGHSFYKWSKKRDDKKFEDMQFRKHLIDLAVEVLDVLLCLGAELGRLGVVSVAGTQGVWKDIASVMSEPDDMLTTVFEELKKTDLGYSFRNKDSKSRTMQLTAGLAFCAACWPMPIYWGFGCGVNNDPSWWDGEFTPLVFSWFDERINTIKVARIPGRVLLKQPVGVDQVSPEPDEADKAEANRFRNVTQIKLNTWRRDGCPQPKDQRIATVRKWRYPRTSWSWTAIYENGDDDPYPAGIMQADPGRLLYAWTCWNRARLQPSEAILLQCAHIAALARWLEGLNGITFKVLRDDELDWRSIKYPPELRDAYLTYSGNQHNIGHKDMMVVLDPKYYPAGTSIVPRIPGLRQEQPARINAQAGIVSQFTSTVTSPTVSSRPSQNLAIATIPAPYTHKSVPPALPPPPAPALAMRPRQPTATSIQPTHRPQTQHPAQLQSANERNPATTTRRKTGSTSVATDSNNTTFEDDYDLLCNPPVLIRAKLTFPARHDDELELHTGDIVQVVSDDSTPKGWLKARWLASNGENPTKEGLVPVGFVEEF